MHYKSGAARNLREDRPATRRRACRGRKRAARWQSRACQRAIDRCPHRCAALGQTYDRDVADVFAIQSEIATSIAGQLQTRLSASERNAIEQAPTNDITAFQLYAQAKNVLAIRNARANLLEASDLLNRAIVHDPSFFKAYCRSLIPMTAFTSLVTTTPLRGWR